MKLVVQSYILIKIGHDIGVKVFETAATKQVTAIKQEVTTHTHRGYLVHFFVKAEARSTSRGSIVLS